MSHYDDKALSEFIKAMEEAIEVIRHSTDSMHCESCRFIRDTIKVLDRKLMEIANE